MLECPRQHEPSLLVSEYTDRWLEPDSEAEGLFRYRRWLPITRTFTGAGGPITYRSEALCRVIGLPNVWVVFSGYWPERGAALQTTTFKDLEASAVLARLPAKHDGVIVVASAGNTAAAFAWACSTNGVPIVIIIPRAGLASLQFPEPLDPCVKIICLTGFTDYSDAIMLAGRVAELEGFFAEGGVKNVGRLDGLGTTMLNAVDTIGRLPDYYLQAIGSGAGAIAACQAAERLVADGRFGEKLPKLILSQNLPFVPIYLSWKSGRRELVEISAEDGKKQIQQLTAQVLSNRRPPYSVRGGVYDVLTESRGDMLVADNYEAWHAASLFEETEGIDIDPAGAVAFATLLKAARAGEIERDALVLLNVTGGGRARQRRDKNLIQAAPTLELDERQIQSDDALEKIVTLVNDTPAPQPSAGIPRVRPPAESGPGERVMSPEERVYRTRTTNSYAFFLKASEYLPGGDSRSPLFYPPYPAVMDRGEGCWLLDLDGNKLLDFTSNHTSLILGYGNAALIEAVQHQLGKGTCFPGASEPQVWLAQLLCERLSSLQQVRFTNSGTEATMNALRGARAFTGRSKVAKIEGGYLGTLDAMMVSTHPPADAAGDVSQPAAVPSTLGLTPGALESVVVLPYNELQASASLIERERNDLAAVIVEPVMASAGMIAAEPQYLHMLREITAEGEILLIFDEVVTLRVAPGGAQEYYGITPDLTCLGKLIGGGLPLGAFGGRKDVMALFDPSRGRPAVPHPGTFNAHPVSLVAGATALELLTPELIDRLNQLAESLRERTRAAFADASIPVQITGLGSLFGIHLIDRPVRSYRDASASDAELRHRIFLGLFNEGVLIDPRGVGCVSAAIGEAEVAQFVDALQAVLSRL